MKKILYNLALISLLKFCNENNIDCSGTHIYKYPRQWTYALVKDDTGLTICTVTFYANRVPTFTY